MERESVFRRGKGGSGKGRELERVYSRMRYGEEKGEVSDKGRKKRKEQKTEAGRSRKREGTVRGEVKRRGRERGRRCEEGRVERFESTPESHQAYERQEVIY